MGQLASRLRHRAQLGHAGQLALALPQSALGAPLLGDVDDGGLPGRSAIPVNPAGYAAQGDGLAILAHRVTFIR